MGRYDNPILTRSLAPIDSSKIKAQTPAPFPPIPDRFYQRYIKKRVALWRGSESAMEGWMRCCLSKGIRYSCVQFLLYLYKTNRISQQSYARRDTVWESRDPILSLWLGDEDGYGVGPAYRPASLCSLEKLELGGPLRQPAYFWRIGSKG